MMKYSKQIILVLALFFPLIISAQSFATFSPDPLFEENDILPGDESLGGRVITITNSGSVAEEYFLGVGSVSNLSMSEDVWITITSGGVEVFNASVFDLSLDPLSLGVIGAGDTKEFAASAFFLPGTDNYAQGQRLTFVVIVGNESGEEVVSGAGSSGGSSGGGGGILPDQLQIYDTRVDSIEQNLGGYDVTIAWLTNLLADSVVVLGLASESYQLDPARSDLGYPFVFDESGERTAHAVTASSLAPGGYRYRVASYQNGVPSISPEYQFEITQEGELTETVLGAFFERQETEAGRALPLLGGVVKGVFDGFITKDSAATQELKVDDATSSLVALPATSGAPIIEGCEPIKNWILVLLTILFGFFADQLLRIKTRLGVGYRVFVGVAVLTVGVLSYLFLECSWLPAAFMFAGILIVVWTLTLRKRRGE